MKHGILCAIVHNVAASLGNGVSFLTGFYELDLFGDAARSRDGRLTVNFLTGKIVEGRPQISSITAARRSKAALARLLRDAGGSISDLTEATATYSANEVFTVTVSDMSGKRSSFDYKGFDGARVLEIDKMGRVRRRPPRKS